MKKEIQKTKPGEYEQLLKDIKSILQRGVTKAYKAVDNLKVQTYWQIGERIVREELSHKDRADYGQRLIEKLASDLGFRRDEVYRIVQFYKTYPIVVTLSQQKQFIINYLKYYKYEKQPGKPGDIGCAWLL